MENQLYHDTVLENDKLSDSTKKIYITNLNRLTDIVSNNLEWIIKHPNLVYNILKHKYNNPNTINMFIKPFYTIINSDKVKSDINVTEYQRWMRILKYSKRKTKIKQLNNIDDDIITYKELLSKLNESIESIDHTSMLILGLYTLIPPIRGEYCKMKIINNVFDIDKNNGNNYIFIGDSYNSSFISISKYKTSKSFGIKKINIPEQLYNIIINCVPKINNYLFQDSNNCPLDIKSFSNLVATKMCKLFNKHITINTFRHAYITEHAKLSESPETRIKISEQMCHSVETQVKYIKLSVNDK